MRTPGFTRGIRLTGYNKNSLSHSSWVKSPRHVFNETTQVKKNRIFLLAGLCAAGFLCGFAGKRLSGGRQDAASGAHAAGNRETRAAAETADDPPASTQPKPGAAKASTLRSTDTLETILALGDQETYGRLALWMLDASEQDIAAYWQSYRQKQDRSNDIADLIFINWTRLNPQGAIAAATGTPNEQHAWWAWACHDPQTALATALATKPDRLNNVAWGIGEFHPEWLRAHMDEIPETSRGNAIAGMTKWSDGENPLETLEFLKKQNYGFDDATFKSLIRKDPWAAFDWIRENEGSLAGRYYWGDRQTPMSQLFASMSETHPDDLQRLADQTPSGELKRTMETALFNSLLKTDPDAALTQAKATKAPMIAAERLAAVGMELLQTDPDKAFELAKSILATPSDALNGYTTVHYKNGSSSWGGGSDSKPSGLINILVERDPQRLLEMNLPDSNNANPPSSAFSQIAWKWANQDLASYTEWVNGQTGSPIRDQAAGVVANQLFNQRQYGEALDWAATLGGNYSSQMDHYFSRWKSTDPEGAREWLETADLPNERKTQLSKQNEP